MIETFTNWFYLIGSIVSAISILTYFLYKAKQLSPNGKSEKESFKFYWALFQLVACHGINVTLGIMMVVLPNPDSCLFADIAFLVFMMFALFMLTIGSINKIVDEYVRDVTEIRQNRLMLQSIKL